MSQQFKVRHLQLGDTQVTEEVLTSQDAATLTSELVQRGRTVLHVEKLRAPPSWSFLGIGKSRTDSPSFSLFCREVSTLIQAGMTIVEATETLAARSQLQGQSASLASILLERLQQGMSLSQAISELPLAPTVLVAAVRAGERTSNLAQALDDYLRFDQLVTQLRKKVVSAAIYPGLVTTIGLVISLFLLLVVMPKFSAMYENLRSGTDGSMALTIEISRFMGNHRSAVMTLLAGLALVLLMWIRSGLAKQQLMALSQRIPWVHARIEDFQLSMMYQALALLLKGGYPMTSAMQVASQSALSPRLQAALGRALRRIEQGSLVSHSLAQEGLCDEVDRRLMAAAERNGSFYRATHVVSQLHGERFELFVERVTRIVEPVLLLAVALVVGGIVVMMYLPVFDMATQLR